MREQWEAAQAGLRVFLDEDSEFLQFLSTVEQEIARKLRFERRSRGGALVESCDVDRFLSVLALLQSFHALFQSKLRPLTDPLEKRGAAVARSKCNELVETLADMLGVLRVPYSRLFATSEVTQASLENALAKEEREWDAEVLHTYLEGQSLTVEKLVARPLDRFNELVEFVEALSKTLVVDVGDGALSSNSDASMDGRDNLTPRLLHIAQENRHYVHLAKVEARAERELIELQTCFQGDEAEAFCDLSKNKLILEAEVAVAVLDGSTTEDVLGTPEQQYVHCFEDGTLVCSTQKKDASGSTFTIQHRVQLKQDAVFLELLPVSVQGLSSSDDSRACALVMRESTIVLVFKDATENQRWVDTIAGYLEVNGSRSEALRQERIVDALPIPEEIASQLQDDDNRVTEFPSFYDDYLPGIFWMAPSPDNETDRWEQVEVVFYARWLLTFRLTGWKKHSILSHFDTSLLEMDISEQPRGDKEWCLVISCGDGISATLVSKKRTRIDFWFDQVSKAIEAAKTAARRAEREKKEREAMAVEESEMCTRGTKRADAAHDDATDELPQKKRKRNSIEHNEQNGGNDVTSSPEPSPMDPNTAKPDDKTDEENGDLDKRAADSTAREDEANAELPTPDEPRRLSKKAKKVKTTGAKHGEDTGAVSASPAVKTPKRRWLKRKSEDPNDTALVETQPSPSAPTDDSISEIDPTQASTNEPAEEMKQVDRQVRIILTGIEITAAIKKKIDAIKGAVYEEDIEKATHIVAPKDTLKRTVKLLCGISCCAHILDERWLDESARVGSPIYERAHCLKDSKAESKWHFDLRKTMYDFTLAQRKQLFAGRQVFITNHKSVLPPVKDLVKIVECAGGKAVTKGSAGPDDLVITSEAAMGTAVVRKALTNSQQIYSPELILSSILQQYLDLDKHRIEKAAAGGSRRRR